MRVLGYVGTLVVITFITMHLFYSNTNVYVPPSNLTARLSSMDTTLFNITEQKIPYTSLYENEPTLNNVVFNIAHGLIYGIFVEVNTLIPVGVHIASGEHSSLLYKLAVFCLLLYFVFLIPIILKSAIALYFFIQEKRKSKTKWYH